MTALRPAVLKLGGELLQDTAHVTRLAGTIALAARRVPLVVIHGGGREIDAALAQAGIQKRQVDGVRVTDERTLDIVVAVLGLLNTRLVASIVSAGAMAVGLTGADGASVPVTRARPLCSSDGELVDLGMVGAPCGTTTPRLLRDLSVKGYVPVVASVSADADGQLYNVNADAMAADVASRLPARRLIIAGSTTGVLDHGARPLKTVDATRIHELIAEGTVRAGMIAKLRACADAVAAGVPEVFVADGTSCDQLAAALYGAPDSPSGCTRIFDGARGRRSIYWSAAGGALGP